MHTAERRGKLINKLAEILSPWIQILDWQELGDNSDIVLVQDEGKKYNVAFTKDEKIFVYQEIVKRVKIYPKDGGEENACTT